MCWKLDPPMRRAMFNHFQSCMQSFSHTVNLQDCLQQPLASTMCAASSLGLTEQRLDMSSGNAGDDRQGHSSEAG